MTYRTHPDSEVQTVKIGNDTIIWQYCVILKNAVIGNNCNINCHVFIENDVIIGDNVTIKSGVQIWDGLRIGNNVFIGPNVTFTNDIFPRSKHYPPFFKKTVVEEGASIGANATVIAGITIGQYSLIGAGSVVTKDVVPFTLWYGNPAKQIGFVTKTGKVVSKDLFDKDGAAYKLENQEPVQI